MSMKIHVRYYAQLREALGTSGEEVTLELSLGEREILECLARIHPAQREMFLASRVAVEDRFMERRELLEAPAALDIISPISGG